MTARDEYWQERLTEQEVEYERRLEALQAKLDKAEEALARLVAISRCTGPDEGFTCLHRESHVIPMRYCPHCTGESALTAIQKR